LDLSKLADLADKNVAFTVYTVDELRKAPPDFRYSVLHDSLPIYGSLNKLGVDFEVDSEELLEWIRGDIAYFVYDCLDSLREKNLRYAYRAAFQAAIRACWLLFVNHGFSLPNNSEETMDFLEKLASKSKLYEQILLDAKTSVLGVYDNVLEIFLTEAKINIEDSRETLDHALTFVAEVLRISVTLRSICENLKHAKRRIQEAEDTRDMRLLSDACQALS
jgi:hypothetical protein